jgi:hypothetical protein
MRAPVAATAWVVASVPASAGAAGRIPAGSEVVRIDASGRASLSEGLAAAGAPAVRHDGARVLFVARERADGTESVLECAPDGSGRRVLVAAAEDCTGAAWLPDGRIVWSARVQGSGAASPHALHVGKGDGTPGERITFGNDDTEPTVLSDGRILFASARAAETGARSVLCTVHPDGSGLAPFHAAALPLARPRQLPSLDVECVETAPDGTRRRVVLDWDAPSRRLADPPAADPPALRPAGGERWGDVVPLAARTRPQGHLSSVKPALRFGTLVAVDARSGGRGAAVRFRTGNAVLGPVPLERDGSFSVRLPADRPFRTEILDATGAVVAGETGAVWVRPGETRLCVGCHDDVETGPPNVRPVALTKDPADLANAEDRR